MTQPLQIEAVIFDLDGTLADTIPLIVASFNAACREPLQRTLSTQEVISRFGIPDAAMLRRELQAFPPETTVLAVEEFYRHYEEQHTMVAAFPGISELLHALKRKGVPLGLMTGKGSRTAEITLRQLGWSDIFGSVITGEDVVNQKPHPEGALKAARELGVEAKFCVFIGDSPADIGAGNAAGMKTIAVAWQDFYTEELRATQPDYVVKTPDELAALLGVSEA